VTWRDLIPFFGWRELTDAEAMEFELEPLPGFRTEVLGFEWFGRGFWFVMRQVCR
jgi:hypothetical protein